MSWIQKVLIPFVLLLTIPAVVMFYVERMTPYKVPYYTIFYVIFGIIIFYTIVRSRIFWEFYHHKVLDQLITIPTFIMVFLTIIFVGLPILLYIKLRPSELYKRSITLARSMIFAFAIRIDEEGSLLEEQVIVLPNHCSDIDDAINPLIMKEKPYKVIFAEEVQRLPLVDFFTKRIGIPVNRSDKTSRGGVALKLQRSVNEGFNILIYPEGRRLDVKRKHELLMPFRDLGAFDTAVRNGIKVQPVVIDWTYLFKPREGQWWFGNRIIKIYYLDPISPVGKTVEELRDEVYIAMKTKLIALQKLRDSKKNKNIMGVLMSL